MSEHGYGQGRAQYGPPLGPQDYQGEQGYQEQAYQEQQAYSAQQAYQAQAAGYPGQGAAYPAEEPPARGILPQAQEVSKGFLASLFDFGFTSFVTPKIVKVLYVLVTIVLGVAALGFLIFCFRLSAALGIVALVILCPLYFFISLAIWRIVMELFIVLFRIADDLQSIRTRGDMFR